MCRHLLESSILSIVLSELQTSHPPPMAPPSQAGRTSAKWRLTADRPSRSNSEPRHLFVTIANRAERLRLNKVHCLEAIQVTALKRTADSALGGSARMRTRRSAHPEDGRR